MVTGTAQSTLGSRTPFLAAIHAAVYPRLKVAAWGGLQPRHVALAAMLGVAAGFVVGPNLVLLMVLAAFLVLNAHVRTFAVCWGLTAAAAAYLHNAAVRIGSVFVYQTPLGTLLERCSDSALVSLLGLHDPALCGGLALAALFSFGAARTLYSTMRDLADSVNARIAAGAGTGSGGSQFPRSTEGSAAGEPWYSGLSAAQLVLARFFWGSLKDAPVRLNRREGWLRPFGWVFAGLLACMLPYLPGWLAERELKTVLLPKLGKATNMHVVAGEIDYSGWTGRLVVRDLALATQPGHLPEVRVARLEAHISPGRILRSQLHAMHVAVDGISMTEPAGKANTKRVLTRGTHARPAATTIPPATGERIDVTNLLAASPHVAQGVRKFTALLDALAALRALEGPHHADAPAGGLPRLYVGKLTLESLPGAWQLGRHATVVLGPISSSPQLVARPTRLKVTAPRHGVRLSGTLNLHKESAAHDIEFEIDEQPLARVIDLKALSGALNVRRGEASLHGVGRVQNQRLDLVVTVDLHGLDIEFAPNSKLAGLDTNLCAELLEASHTLSIPLRLRGPLHAPRWELSRSALAAQLAGCLELAGRKDLKRRLRLALAPREHKPRPAPQEVTVPEVASTPVEPVGEPQAIATDEPSQPGVQPEAPSPAVQAEPYPRTSTPDEEDPPAIAADVSPASELTTGVHPVPYTQGRNSSLEAWPTDEEGLAPDQMQASERKPLPPEIPLPGPIGLNLGQEQDVLPLAQARQPGLARPTKPRFKRPVPQAATASYVAPTTATGRGDRQDMAPADMDPVGTLPAGTAPAVKAPAGMPQAGMPPAGMTPGGMPPGGMTPAGTVSVGTAPAAKAPAEYMHGPRGVEPVSEPGVKQPKSSFSRWARSIVNKVLGEPSARPQPEDEAQEYRGQPVPSPVPENRSFDADAESWPYEAPAEHRKLPWYRRLWR